MKTRKGFKAYPLTVAQKFHEYYANVSPGKEILNVGTSLTIEFELDLDELSQPGPAGRKINGKKGMTISLCVISEYPDARTVKNE